MERESCWNSLCDRGRYVILLANVHTRQECKGYMKVKMKMDEEELELLVTDDKVMPRVCSPTRY